MRGESKESGLPTGIPAVEAGISLPEESLLELDEPIDQPISAAITAPVPLPNSIAKETTTTPPPPESPSVEEPAFELLAELKNADDAVELEAEINKMMEEEGGQ